MSHPVTGLLLLVAPAFQLWARLLSLQESSVLVHSDFHRRMLVGTASWLEAGTACYCAAGSILLCKTSVLPAAGLVP